MTRQKWCIVQLKKTSNMKGGGDIYGYYVWDCFDFGNNCYSCCRSSSSK